MFKGREGIFASDRMVSEIFKANPSSAVVDEGQPVVIDVAGNDTAPVHGLNLNSIVIVNDVSYGTTTVNGDGTVTYTHDGLTEEFSDSFTYKIQNNNGEISNTATVVISINPVNDTAPVFTSPIAANVAERTTLVHTVTATDADGSLLTYSINGTGPDDAKFQITISGVMSFVQAPNFEAPTDVGADGVYNVDVLVNDGVFNVVQSIAVTVTDAAENPIAANDAFTVGEGATSSLNVLPNDTDPQNDIDASTVTVIGQPANGSASVQTDGRIIYIHNGSETTSDTLTYLVQDTEGNLSNTATISLTITPANDAPIAVNDVFTVTQGTTTNINLATNDTDIDNALDLTSITIISAPSEGALVDNNDGTVAYTNTSTGASSDSFTYTIDDVSGSTSNIATATITVNAAILLSLWNSDGSVDSVAPTYPPANTQHYVEVNNGGANTILWKAPAGAVLRQGERPVVNLASGLVSETVTVISGREYQVYGKGGNGDTIALSGAATATLTMDGVNEIGFNNGNPIAASSTSLTLTVTGLLTELSVVDVTGFTNQKPPEYVSVGVGVGDFLPIYLNKGEISGVGNIPYAWLLYNPANVVSSDVTNGVFSFSSNAHLAGLVTNGAFLLNAQNTGDYEYTIRARRVGSQQSSETLQVYNGQAWQLLVPPTANSNEWVEYKIKANGGDGQFIILSRFSGDSNVVTYEIDYIRIKSTKDPRSNIDGMTWSRHQNDGTSVDPVTGRVNRGTNTLIPELRRKGVLFEGAGGYVGGNYNPGSLDQWLKPGGGISVATDGTMSPLGLPAELIAALNPKPFYRQAHAILNTIDGNDYAVKIYVKKGNWPYVAIQPDNGVSAFYYDFDTDTYVDADSTYVRHQLLPDGWVEITLSITAANNNMFFFLAQDLNGSAYNNTPENSSVYFGGLIYNEGAVPKSFTDLSSVAATNDVQVTLADFGFDGASSGSFKVDLTFNHDGDQTPAQDYSLITLNGSDTTGLLYLNSAGQLASHDGTNSVNTGVIVSKDTLYEAEVAYTVGGNLTIFVGGVQLGSLAWNDDWNIGTLIQFAKGYPYGVYMKNVEALL